VVLVIAVYLYARGGHTWGIFAALFFLPDISFAGYFAGPRVGAAVYNVAHSYVGPLLLAGALLTTGPNGFCNVFCVNCFGGSIGLFA
jgi:hypothetical protein